jgi:hypothetical protein
MNLIPARDGPVGNVRNRKAAFAFERPRAILASFRIDIA